MSPRIVALQGAASFVVQTRLVSFARARSAEGLRVAGAIEEQSNQPGAGCSGRWLRDLTTGRRHEISQDLGPSSLACHLDAAGVADACADAMRAIEAGCDLVVLAKFGKLEAVRSGLIDAFAAAVAHDVPVVTSVAPFFTPNWLAYAGELASFVAPRGDALESWWRSLPESRKTRDPLRSAG